MNAEIETPRIRFLGAAGTVTGSKYLLTYKKTQILVDCGLFQGLKELRLKNWDRFPTDPKSIDAIVLTHAHIDHSGYIPRLIKEGFKGKIYCTAATLELCKILLPDTGYLQEEEAEYLNKRHLSKHDPALPLFTKDDAENSLEFFVPKEFAKEFEITPEVEVTFHYAGHILGAAQALVKIGNVTIGFSGDLGRMNDPIFNPPELMPKADYLIVESTYGNRCHENSDPKNELGQIVRDAAKEKGVVVIPAFAVGRAQSGMATGGRVLHHLKAFAPNPKNTILLAGFQAKGTRGRLLQEGAKEIKIHREFVPVRAHVKTLENLSAHADSREILSWLQHSDIQPKRVFVTHGEPESAFALKELLQSKLHVDCIVPVQDQEFSLGAL